MTIFDPVPTYRVAHPFENARLALDMPLTPLNTLWQGAQTGFVDSFGLGSAVKDFSTPRGLPTTDMPDPFALAVRSNPLTAGFAAGYEALRGALGTPTTGAPMNEEEWKASEFRRDGIKWDAGMTTDRAAALATMFDQRAAREYFGQKNMPMFLAGNLLGAIPDPINYVPVFGASARVAATARFGFIAGHAAIGASEAAINTAVFGALTTPFRARLGEDVSFEAAINNIAFSAIAGAAFGGVFGAVGRLASRRAQLAERNARFAMEDIRNLKDARDVLNDAVGSIVERGEVALSPRSKAVLERLQTEAVDRVEAARALDTETAAVRGSKAGEVVISPSGARVAVRPEVVDISTLQRATGDLQARDRSAGNAASNAQIEDIAINLDPARLMPNVDGSQGAPLVGPDNIVDSGNGRTAAIARAYEAYPEKAAAYRQALEDAGYSTEGIDRPVLIQRRMTDLSPEARAQFNADVNASTVSRMTAVEIAALDRGALTDSVLSVYADAPVTAAANRAFVARFLGNLPINERASLVDGAGALNADGARRIENAMVAAAYGDVDATALRKFAEATDDNTRAIVGALSDIAGRWIGLRRAVERGEVKPEMDMTVELVEALRRLSTWREQAAREGRPVGTVIKEGLAQADLLSGQIPAETKIFLTSFYRDRTFTRPLGREALAERLNDVVDKAMAAGQPDMLGDAYAATRLGVLKNVYGDDLAADVFATDGTTAGVGEIGGPRAEPGPESVLAGDRGVPVEGGSGRPGADAAGTAAEPAALKPTDTPEFRAADTVRVEAPGPAAPDRAEISANLLRMADAGDIEGIKASPELQQLVADMRSRPETTSVEGYDTDKWARERVYTSEDGQKIEGVEAAYDYLLDNARTLAAKELDVPRFEIATERKAVIVIGPPAAGKSTIANQLALRLRAAIPDADEAKKIMPEYDGGMGSNAVHEESSFLAEAVIDALSLNGDNMVIPKVGGKVSSIENLTAQLKQRGYTVDVALMDVAPEEAFRRMIGRYVSSGRLIPPEYFETVAAAPAKVFDELKARGIGDGHAKISSARGISPEVSESSLRTIAIGKGDAISIGERGSRGGDDAVGHEPDGLTGDAKSVEPELPELYSPRSGVYRETPAGRLEYDDVLQAQLFDLGVELARLNNVAPGEPWPRNLRLGHLEGETRRLLDAIGGYLDPPARNPGDLARAAIEIAEADLDVGNGRALSAIDPERYYEWSRGRGRPAPVDIQQALPLEPPDGLDAAAARVGRGEDLRALADQFGVDGKTGDYPEAPEIEAMRATGRLTPEDEAELRAADETFEQAEAYAEALRVAASCVMG